MDAVAGSTGSGWTAANIVALVVGVVAFVGVVLGVRQRWRADRRDQWWKRTQWAIERLGEGGEARIIGLVILWRLVDSRLATGDDQRMLEDVADVDLSNYDGSL